MMGRQRGTHHEKPNVAINHRRCAEAHPMELPRHRARPGAPSCAGYGLGRARPSTTKSWTVLGSPSSGVVTTALGARMGFSVRIRAMRSALQSIGSEAGASAVAAVAANKIARKLIRHLVIDLRGARRCSGFAPYLSRACSNELPGSDDTRPLTRGISSSDASLSVRHAPPR